MIVTNNDIAEAVKVWPTVAKVISTIHSKTHYLIMVKLLDSLIDEVSQTQDKVKESLIDTLGTLIKDYEDRNVSEPNNDTTGNLKYLMEEHSLKQKDLSEIGSQGIVSEILSGKRKLNLRQITVLSERFNVSPSVFIDT